MKVEAEKLDLVEHFSRLLEEKDIELGFLQKSAKVQRSGVEWSGVEWSGVEWSGVEWSGVEWSGVGRRLLIVNTREKTTENIQRVIIMAQWQWYHRHHHRYHHHRRHHQF